MKAKKAVIFIVEGITDKISLGSITSRLSRDRDIRFAIMNGDVTSDGATNRKNAVDKMTSRINRYCRDNFLKRSDIERIVHLVDSDGAYIEDKHIEKSQGRRPEIHDQAYLCQERKICSGAKRKKREIMDVPFPHALRYSVSATECITSPATSSTYSMER